MGTEEASVTECKEVPSVLENKIIRQIEYYFGDYNLLKDKFLREKMKENDGWIPLETMVKFNRLKELSSDYEVINAALKKSPNKLMEVNEDGTSIRRSLSKPLPDSSDQSREDRDHRTVYVKGFKVDTSLDELLDFFKPYKNPENVFMRRRPNKKFKGSVYVTFTSKEDAQEFMELKDVKHQGTDLLKESKLDYLKRKQEQYEERRKAKVDKQKSSEDKQHNKTERVAKIEKQTEEQVKGCLMKLVGFSDNTTMREHIKEVLNKHGNVTYVDYSKGLPKAVVRFGSPIASEVLEKATTEVDGVRKVEINGTEVVATVLEGDEETEYFKSIEELKERIRSMKKGSKRRGGFGRHNKRGRGHFNRGRKRKHGSDDDQSNDDGSGGEDEPKTKALKVESADNEANGKTTEDTAVSAMAE